ncbi:MAG: hypothetical protein CL489_10510 [Acidobacteria bacterium]|nr:hypothetical protein [Acidobacteriota bacterium]|tara:strand:- start:777 stop:965 length:189 start_codon:yes stop_codon:yes gene_type:complete
MKDLIEAFEIFAKYTEDKYCFGCEHDELFVYVDPEDVSSEDLKRLKELGFKATSYDTFVKYC